LAGPGAKYAFKKEMKLYDAFIPILIYTSRNLISLEYLICYFLFNSEHTRYLQKKTVQARHDAYQLQLYERLAGMGGGGGGGAGGGVGGGGGGEGKREGKRDRG
jgi:hypothetical protein